MNRNPHRTNARPLAIIVPAYKTKYLRLALDSIAAQTDQNFQLYVFDDCSPEPVGKIMQEFGGRVPVTFHRFNDNAGGDSIARHLARCVHLTSEPWVWIFADDDLMEPGCVADFYAELNRTQSGHDLYRFDTVWVDGAGARISESPRHPPSESGTDFLLARLSMKRNVTLQEIIFSRRAWESAGGLPDFPLGWHADEALTASLGVRQPLRAIPGARVHWRLSDVNVSSSASFRITNRKIIASVNFFHWVVKFFQAHAAAQTGAAIRVSEGWLMNYLATCWEFLGVRTCFALDGLAREAWQRPPGWGFFTGVRMNLQLLVNKIRHRLLGKGNQRCPPPSSSPQRPADAAAPGEKLAGKALEKLTP